MRRIIIESPYAGEVERNLAYARAAMRDSLLRGESPIASHLLYTQPGILDDDIPEERELGIKAGLAWSPHVEGVVFYMDHGMSRGMNLALNWHRGFHRNIEYRYLYSKDSSDAHSDWTSQCPPDDRP